MKEITILFVGSQIEYKHFVSDYLMENIKIVHIAGFNNVRGIEFDSVIWHWSGDKLREIKEIRDLIAYRMKYRVVR